MVDQMPSQVERVVNGRNKVERLDRKIPTSTCVLGVDVLAAKRVRRAKMVPQKTKNTPVFQKNRGKQGVQMSAGYPFRHWSVASSRTVLANRVLKVRQDTCVIPASGGALEHFVLELADWVNVVPVTSARELGMVGSYRPS